MKLCALAILVVMQTAPALKHVSVTLNTTGASGKRGFGIEPGGRLLATNVSVRELLQFAYQRHRFDRPEISGAPAWVDVDRFDITAIADRDLPQPALLQTLLADRFKLRLRTESKETQVYVLRMTRSDGTPGPKLVKSDIDCDVWLEKFRSGERPAFDPEKGPPCSISPHKGRLKATTITMAELASVLSGFVGRRVVDRTGLAGRFDLDLVAAEIPAMGPPGPSYRPPDSSPSIFTALPEQLGLAIESTTGAVDVLVIDSVERPTP